MDLLDCRPPDPASARDVSEFTSLLRLLKVWAGDPSFEELRRRSHVPSSTLADAVSTTRTRLPRLEVVRGFVHACGGTVDDLARWASAWRAIQARQRGTAAPQRCPGVAPPHQLPRDVPHFVGRRDALQRLDRMQHEHAAVGGGSPLALLVGAPGVGKSALAVHWAHRMVDAYPDGQLYVDLGDSSRTAAVTAYEALPLLLRAIGVPDRDTPSDPVARASLYRSLTYARRFLIVLDGARDGEHVRPLLPGGPLCLTLVTSRNRLSELVAREGGTRVSMAPLRPQEAERLIEASIGGEHAAVGAEPVRRLARLCGYLPLALRVATASLTDRPQAPPVAVLARLAAEDRLAELLLTGNAVVAVRAAFDFAYAGLDEPARRLFRRMASAPAP